VQLVVDTVARALVGLSKLPLSKPKELPGILVGLEIPQARIVQLLTEEGKKRIVLLHGMGGIGKTTLAKAVFNQLHERDLTVPCHFLELGPEMRDEESQVPKQWELLKHLAYEGALKPGAADQARRLIAGKLEGRKVLLVVDSVWGDQLKWLLPRNIMEVLGEGSVVLVTSRDQGVVTQLLNNQHSAADAGGHRCTIYEVECLGASASVELFWRHFTGGSSSVPAGRVAAAVCKRAFGSDSCDDMDKLAALLDRCGGLPTAVELAAKHLAGLECSAAHDFFEDLDDTLEYVYRELFARLQPSWDALGAANKEALLDIVWFLQGRCWGLMACYCNPLVLKELQKLGLVRTYWIQGAGRREQQQAVRVHPVLADFCKLHCKPEPQRRFHLHLDDPQPASDYLGCISVRLSLPFCALHNLQIRQVMHTWTLCDGTKPCE
jgi:hypothetical protein